MLLKPFFVIVVLLFAGCARSQFLSARPTDSNVASKLRLTAQEWQEIQSEFQKKIRSRDSVDLKVLYWARSKITDTVEVGCFDASLGTPATHGPVFFFAVRDGHWRVLNEMSEWKDKD